MYAFIKSFKIIYIRKLVYNEMVSEFEISFWSAIACRYLIIPLAQSNVNYARYNEIRSWKSVLIVFSTVGQPAVVKTAIIKAAVCISLKLIALYDKSRNVY